MMIKIAEHISLADKTTYRIGGPARYYAEPSRAEDVAELYRYAYDQGISVFVLGCGSNILISDRGIDGLVINLSANFAAINWDGCAARAQTGYPLDRLAAESAARGLTGIEELSGIPGTVGGAAVMNAGAFDTEIADTLKSMRVLRVPSMTIEDIDAASLGLGYRSSVLKGGNDVALSAVFEFAKENAPGLALRTRENVLARRREKQPLDKPSCGSVFKRPPGGYAGTLIESCGLKGFKIGGAAVSEKHANFIVNTGGATARDVRAVIGHIQKIVYENSGISLEPEVIFIGDF